MTSASPWPLSLKAYGVLVPLALALSPVWAKPLFESSINGLREVYPGKEGLKRVADNLRGIANGLQLLQRSELTHFISLLEILRQQPATAQSSSAASKNPQWISSVRPQLNLIALNHGPSFKVSRGLTEEVRSTLTYMEVLDLFAKCLETPILRRVPNDLRNILLKRYLGDFVDRLSDSTPLSQLYLLCAQDGQDTPERSALLKPGESDVFQIIIAMNKVQLDIDRGVEPDAQSEGMDKLLKRLELYSGLLAFEYILGLLPTLAKGNKIDQYLHLLLSRLKYIESTKKLTTDGLVLERKLLVQELQSSKRVEHPGSISINPNNINFGGALSVPLDDQLPSLLSDNVTQKEDIVANLEAEEKTIFKHLFTLLYTATGVEMKEVEVVALPSWLNNIKWINWLWEKIYCNRKMALVKTSLKDRGSPAGLKDFEAFVVRKGPDTKPLLIQMLKKLLSTDSKGLRQSIIAWLLQEGKLGLLQDVDTGLADRELTAELCDLIRSEGLLENTQALENQTVLLENLKARGEATAVVRLVQDMVDNTAANRVNEANLNNILSLFLGTDQPGLSILSPSLTKGQLEGYLGVVNSKKVLKNRERINHLIEASQLLAKSISTLKNKDKMLKSVEDRLSMARFQQESLDELEILENITLVQGSVADVDVSLGLAKLQLIKSILNFKLWDTGVIRNRVLIPLDLHKLLVYQALDNKRLDDSQTIEIINHSIRSTLSSCAKQQTLSDVKARLGAKEVLSTKPYFEITDEKTMSNLEQLWKLNALWPTNAISQLTPMLSAILAEKREGLDLTSNLAQLTVDVELANSLNPYMQLLLDGLNEYMTFHVSGLAEPNSTNPKAKPYLRLLASVNPWWLSDLLVHVGRQERPRHSSPIQTVTNYAFSLFTRLTPEAIERNQSLPDLQELKVYRVGIVLARVVNSIIEELSRKRNPELENRLAGMAAMIRALFNEIVSRIGNSGRISLEMKKFANHQIINARGCLNDISESKRRSGVSSKDN